MRLAPAWSKGQLRELHSRKIRSLLRAVDPRSDGVHPLFQQDAHRIIRRRAKAAGIETRIGNHTFRATGITAYLKNSGKLEVAQQIANHESPRTTKLYDRRQDEIERITI
jgi:integrase